MQRLEWLAVALDTPGRARLEYLAALLGPRVGALKVGLEAYTALGPAAIQIAAAYAPVFCDLKLHDIPQTVAGAAAAAARHGAMLLTVHASGGPAMVAAAARAAPEVDVLGVTVLTSLGRADLSDVGQAAPEVQVPRLARIAVDAGAAGIVCAGDEIESVRAEIGPAGRIVVPGVRLAELDRDDQARVVTPRAALGAGADMLVIGRPITTATDPLAVVQSLHDALETGEGDAAASPVGGESEGEGDAAASPVGGESEGEDDAAASPVGGESEGEDDAAASPVGGSQVERSDHRS